MPVSLAIRCVICLFFFEKRAWRRLTRVSRYTVCFAVGTPSTRPTLARTLALRPLLRELTQNFFSYCDKVPRGQSGRPQPIELHCSAQLFEPLIASLCSTIRVSRVIATESCPLSGAVRNFLPTVPHNVQSRPAGLREDYAARILRTRSAGIRRTVNLNNISRDVPLRVHSRSSFNINTTVRKNKQNKTTLRNFDWFFFNTSGISKDRVHQQLKIIAEHNFEAKVNSHSADRNKSINPNQFLACFSKVSPARLTRPGN